MLTFGDIVGMIITVMLFIGVGLGTLLIMEKFTNWLALKVEELKKKHGEREQNEQR